MFSVLRKSANHATTRSQTLSTAQGADAPMVYSHDGFIAKSVSPIVPLSNGRVSLQPNSAKHVDRITDLLHHDTFERLELFSPGDGATWRTDRAEVHEYVQSRVDGAPGLQCFTALHHGKTPIGIVEIQRYQRSTTHPHEANLAYWFTGSASRPKGSATYAIAQAVSAAFAGDPKINRIYAWTEKNNMRSQRVIKSKHNFSPFRLAHEQEWAAFTAASREPNDPNGHALFVKRREDLAADALDYYLAHHTTMRSGPTLSAHVQSLAT